MKELIPLHDLARDRNLDLNGIYDPTGQPAYGRDGERVGKVRSALADPDTGRLRYLLVDAGGWFSSKDVLVPVGLARTEDDGVYFDTLTKEQVQNLHGYTETYDDDAAMRDESIFRGSDYGSVSNRDDTSMTGTMPSTGMTSGVAGTGMTSGVTGAGMTTGAGDTTMTSGVTGSGMTSGVTDSGTYTDAGDTTMRTGTTGSRYNYRDDDADDRLFKANNRLQLLEERLLVDKDRYVAGSVEIGKHVETRQQQVNVDVSHEEVVIERRPVTDTRPVEGNVTLGSDRDAIRVDLEAERADVRKQAYVTEEVEIGKRTETETQTITETVGREVLDVNRTGDVDVSGMDTRNISTTGTTTNGDRGLLDKADGAIDRLDGKIDRDQNR